MWAAVHLGSEAFAAAEVLAPRLWSVPRPEPAWFVGYVDGLRGQPGPADRPAGEVLVTIFRDQELVRARLDLSVEDYETADRAHMTNTAVVFSGVLSRAPRVGRIEHVRDFQLLAPRQAPSVRSA